MIALQFVSCVCRHVAKPLYHGIADAKGPASYLTHREQLLPKALLQIACVLYSVPLGVVVKVDIYLMAFGI